MLESYNIKYVMCDAFDLMVQSLNKEDDITYLINKTNYWGFSKISIEQWMMKNYSGQSIWEKKTPNPMKIAQHPNKEGYKLISEELYNYIVKTNII
jgi:hypothetical protein